MVSYRGVQMTDGRMVSRASMMFVLTAISVVVSTATAGGLLVLATTAWSDQDHLLVLAAGTIGLSVHSGYWMFWRLAYHLELTDSELVWRAVFRRGAVPFAFIRRVERHRTGPMDG